MPGPSPVCSTLMVGFCEVLQHTPLAITVLPPLLVTSPPLLADVLVIEVGGMVVTTGTIAPVVKLSSSPYEVPTLFVA